MNRYTCKHGGITYGILAYHEQQVKQWAILQHIQIVDITHVAIFPDHVAQCYDADKYLQDVAEMQQIRNKS